MNRKNKIKLSIVYFIIICICCFYLLPFLWMLRSSFTELSQIFDVPPRMIPNPFTWDNYVKGLTFIPFGRYFLNSSIIVSLTLLGVLLTSSLAAFGFSRVQWKGRDFFFMLVLSSMMLPAAVTLVPTFIAWQKLGFYNTYVPLIVPLWFGGGAYNIFLLRQFYMGIPLSLDESAYVDGAGYFRIYWNVILPLSRPALVVVGLLAFIFYWNDFFSPVIYLKDDQLFTLSLGLQRFQGIYSNEWGWLMAASTVVILPSIIVFLIGQKSIIQGIALTGVKG
jgi:multiple sugar transport system permease protein